MILDKQKLEIISEEKKDNNLIYLEDIVCIRFFYSEEDYEEDIVKLTGKYFPVVTAKIKEITINSPLGKALYLQKIGSKVKYFVNEKEIMVEILEKR